MSIDAWPNGITESLVETPGPQDVGWGCCGRQARLRSLLTKQKWHREAVAAPRPCPPESTERRPCRARGRIKVGCCLTQPMFSETLLVNIITKHAGGPGPVSGAHGASSICRHGRYGGGPRSARR